MSPPGFHDPIILHVKSMLWCKSGDTDILISMYSGQNCFQWLLGDAFSLKIRRFAGPFSVPSTQRSVQLSVLFGLDLSFWWLLGSNACYSMTTEFWIGSIRSAPFVLHLLFEGPGLAAPAQSCPRIFLNEKSDFIYVTRFHFFLFFSDRENKMYCIWKMMLVRLDLQNNM